VQQIADMAGIAMPIADPAMEKREKERTSLTT
jgi:DNA primase